MLVLLLEGLNFNMLVNPLNNIKQFWIAFEGISGCGKSTIIKEVFSVLDPLIGPIKIITEKTHPILQNNVFSNNNLNSTIPKEYLVYYWWLARRLNLDYLKKINCNCILYDRYYDSTYVYGPITSLDDIKYNFSNIFQMPDVTFYLRLKDLNVAFNRNSLEYSDPYEAMDLEKLKYYQKRYDDLYLNSPYRTANIHFIDAQESISNITSTIIDILKNKYHIMDKNFFNNI